MTTIHKLMTEREGRDAGSANIHIALNSGLHDLAAAVVRARAVRACDLGTRSLPIFRELRWSVRRKVIDVFDDLALDESFAPQRVSAGSLLLSAPGVFVTGHGHDKGDYCSCVFKVWAESRARADEVAGRLQKTAGPQHCATSGSRSTGTSARPTASSGMRRSRKSPATCCSTRRTRTWECP